MDQWILVIDEARVVDYEETKQAWLNIGIRVELIFSIDDVLETLRKHHYVLFVIVADDNKSFRKIHYELSFFSTPVMIVTKLYNASDKVEAIQLGADEYLLWPGTAVEAVSSGQAIIRRAIVSSSDNNHTLSYKNILIRTDTRRAFFCGIDAKLTNMEYEMLVLLMKHPGRTYTSRQLYQTLWGGVHLVQNEASSVWNLINRLRAKMNAVDHCEVRIKSIRGYGYCIE